MADVRILDVTDYLDRSNPALTVPAVIVTFIAPDGRVRTLRLPKDRASREAIESRVREEAVATWRLAPPVNVRWADHLLPTSGR